MQEKPIIFISHSTGRLDELDLRVQIRDALASSLSDAGWDVFLDVRRIEAGMQWRIEILRNLATANACIILFDEFAAESDWVLAEITAMCFRKAIDPTLPVVPVVFGSADFDAKFLRKLEPFQFKEIQHSVISVAHDSVPFAIAERLAQLPSLSIAKACEVGRSAWTKFVAEWLDGLSIDVLDELAIELNVEIDNLPMNVPHNRLQLRHIRWGLANRLHEGSYGDCLKALAIVAQKVQSEKLRSLANYLVVKLVPHQAVELMHYALRNPNLCRWLVLQPGNLEIAEHYKNRAHKEMHKSEARLHCVEISSPPGPIEHVDILVSYIERQLIKKFIRDGDDLMSARDRLQRKIVVLFEQPFVYVLCLLPSVFNQHEVIDEISKRYPRFVFMVYSDHTGARFPHGATALKPELTNEDMDRFSNFELDCDNIISRYTS